VIKKKQAKSKTASVSSPGFISTMRDRSWYKRFFPIKNSYKNILFACSIYLSQFSAIFSCFDLGINLPHHKSGSQLRKRRSETLKRGKSCPRIFNLRNARITIFPEVEKFFVNNFLKILARNQIRPNYSILWAAFGNDDCPQSSKNEDYY